MSQLPRFLLGLALVGCGDNRETPAVDSPLPSDSMLPDGPPPPVTVTARNRFTPAAGVRIVFLADDDSVIDNVVTDATGTASAMVPPSSKVVAMGPAGTTGHLWLGVEPGDQLSLDLGAPPTTETTTVIVPAVANSTYNVETNCTDGFASSQTTTVTLDIAADCPVTDVVVYRQVIGNIVEALVVRNQTLTPGGTLDLSAMSYTPFIQGTVRVTGIPAGPASVFLEGSRALGLEPILGRFADNLVPVAGAAEISGSLADVPVAQVSLAQVRTQTATHILMRRGGSGPLALDGVTLPEVGAPAFATRTVTWTQGASGQPVEGVFAQLLFGGVQWFIASPAATSLAIPALPSELAAIDPDTLTYQRGQLRLFDVPGDYDDARPVMFALRSARGLLGGDGLVVISDSGALNQ